MDIEKTDFAIYVYTKNLVLCFYNPLTTARLYGWKNALSFDFSNTEDAAILYTPLFSAEYYK